MHKSSFGKMEMFIGKYLDKESSLSIVEIGSLNHNGSCVSLFDCDNWIYKGIDTVEGEGVDVVIDSLYDMSIIGDNTVSIVISGQTFERIPHFWKVFEEVSRILEPSGLFCLIASSAGRYGEQGDLYRFSSEGLRVLSDMSGLQVQECTTDNTGEWRDSILVARKPAQDKPKRYTRVSKKTMEEPKFNGDE